jgi:hypothetical protein
MRKSTTLWHLWQPQDTNTRVPIQELCGRIRHSWGEGYKETRPKKPNRGLHLGAELVHDVTELVEVGLHLVVLQQGRGAWCGLREVRHHGRDGYLAAAILPQAARLQAEAGCVSILPFPGEEHGVRPVSATLAQGGSLAPSGDGDCWTY